MPPRILIIHNHNHINLKIKKTVLQTHQARKAELENLLTDTHQSLRQMQREWKQHKQEFHHGAPPPYTRQNSGYESKETGH